MPIRQRGSSWQIDVAFGKLRKQMSVESEFEAKRLEPILLQELKEKAAGKESKKWSLGTAINKTLELVWKGTPSERTHMVNANILKKFFGSETLLSDIDTERVDSLILWLEDEQEVCSSTVNRYLACLSKILTVAVERGVITARPKLERKQEGQGRIRWVTVEEERKIIDFLTFLGKYDHVDFTTFFVDTGCRPSEAFRLTSRDCNFDTGMVTFWETKNKGSRSVPMTFRVRDILQRRCKDSVRPFPFSVDWYRQAWDRAKAHLGLQEDKGFVPYCLRHTCASRLIQKGFRLEQVKAWLGHKTLTMTLRYAHLAPDSLMAGARLLEQVQQADSIRAAQ